MEEEKDIQIKVPDDKRIQIMTPALIMLNMMLTVILTNSLVAQRIENLLKQIIGGIDAAIIATVISYGLYLIGLLCILICINKVWEKKENTEDSHKEHEKKRKCCGINLFGMLKTVLRFFVKFFHILIFIFKFLFICNNSHTSFFVKATFLVLLFLVNCLVYYCFDSYDVIEINSFQQLFFINKNKEKNEYHYIYKFFWFCIIILLLYFLAVLIAINLGIDFKPM